MFGRLPGYEDVNDTERLARNPVVRAVVDRKGLERSAASTSQMGRYETEWLAGTIVAMEKRLPVVHRFLLRLSSLELRLYGSLDRYALSSAWIAALACAAISDAEGSEPNETKLVPCRE